MWRADGTGVPVTFGARENDSLEDVALSPDGRHVALGYHDGLVRLHAIDGAGAPVELRGPGHQVTDLSWRSDASQLLVSSREKQPGVTIRRSQLWNVNDPGAAWRDFPGSTTFVPATGLVTTDANPSPLWGPVRSASLHRNDGATIVEFADARRIEAAPSGAAVLVITDRALRLHGLDGVQIGAAFDHAALLAADETLMTAKFTPNGSRIITTTSEDRMFVWAADTATLLREIDAPPRPQAGMLMWGLQLAVSPDSALLARGYADRTVRVWDLDGKSVPLTLRGHLHSPHELQFSPDSRTLATATIYTRGFSKTEGLQRERGDFDPTIRLWPLPEARTVRFSPYGGKPGSEADLRWTSYSPWTPDGRGLVVNDGLTLKLHDTSGELVAPAVTLPAHHESLKEPIFTADGNFVTFESAHHWVRWDLRDPSRVETVAQPEREQGRAGANLSRDGALVYYVSPARDAVRIYRFDGHALVRQIDHDAAVERVEFSPRGDRIMTVTKDRRVRVWSLTGDAPPAEFRPEGEGSVHSLWSPDGAFVALGVGTRVKDEYAFFVWRPGEGAAPELRLTTPAVIQLLRVSPDGRHLAILGRDDRLRLVSSTGELSIRELDPVDSEPGRFEFSRDGAWLISRASNAAFIWSTTTGAIVRVLRSPEQQLTLAAFDPSSTAVLLGGRDGVMTIVPFDPELARADLQTRLRAATSYCYSQARRRIDLNEPPALAWANYSTCERSYGREPGPDRG